MVNDRENMLLVAKTLHRRTIPKHNSFNYGVCYLCFNLSQMLRLKTPIFAVDGRNIFSFNQNDHGNPALKNEQWIREILAQYQITQADGGEILLITMPRMFGYIFNPVSFWLCYDLGGNIRAVISEVNNTFREAHFYISFHDDFRPITKDDWLIGKKIFHVSPFMQIEGEYHYRFIADAKRIAIWINYHTDKGLMLETSLIGKRIKFSTFNLIKYNLRYPLCALRVMGLIHYQAIKLLAKRIKYNNKPPKPLEDISR